MIALIGSVIVVASVVIGFLMAGGNLLLLWHPSEIVVIIGAALAYVLATGFVPIRKKGKLPGKTMGRDYDLEYGTDRVEIHVDAIAKGEKILLVDDLIATGGTAEAAAALVQDLGGVIVECCFVIDLPDIGGRKRLEGKGLKVFAQCEFEGD